MADNVTDGSGNVFATDQSGGTIHYPIEKIAFGALDTFTLVSVANPFPVTQGGATSWDHGSNRDIDASAEQIAASGAALHGVWVKAAPANTGTVYLGNSDVTAGTTDATDGWPLDPGESVFIAVNNVNLIYAIGSAANQIVYWRTE